MNVANLDLCRELYELSGWEADDWYDLDENGKPYEHLATLEDIDIADNGNTYIPAYDLGYLLRKLRVTVKGDRLEIVPRDSGSWFIGYTYNQNVYELNEDEFLWKDALAPEDAAAKLAIELFKQGVLSKEKS